MTTTVLQMMDAISASLNSDIYVKDPHQYVFQHVEMELEKALNFAMGRVSVDRTVNQSQMLSLVELIQKQKIMFVVCNLENPQKESLYMLTPIQNYQILYTKYLQLHRLILSP